MRRSPIMNSPVLKGDRHARVAKLIPRPMVLQISRGVGAEISETSDLRPDATWDWEDRSGAVSAARRGVDRRARAVGSRACLVGYSAEAECGEHGRVSEREVGDPNPPRVTSGGHATSRATTSGRAATASAPSVWRKRSSAITSGSRKQTRRNRRSWNFASRRPLRGALIIPPPQGAVADWSGGSSRAPVSRTSHSKLIRCQVCGRRLTGLRSPGPAVMPRCPLR